MKIHISPPTYRRITFWTIVALGAIVLTGVSVRLTGSGLGCPDWPNCDNQFFPTEENQYHAWIEFGNRLVTGVVSVAVVLAVLGIFWMLFRSPLRLPEEALKPMYVLMVVIATQGFIGYLQYFNDVPELLVGLHVLGAISVWWATLHAHFTVWNAHLEQQNQLLLGSERQRELQHR